MPNDLDNWTAAAAGAKSNVNAITYPQATALWGSVVGIGIFDALSGGHLLDFAALVTARTVNNGDTYSIAIGQLNISQA